jgi:hypothetical protein
LTIKLNSVKIYLLLRVCRNLQNYVLTATFFKDKAHTVPPDAARNWTCHFTQIANHLMLYLYIFRRKPAVVEFDKPITPNHKLSKSFATDTGSSF